MKPLKLKHDKSYIIKRYVHSQWVRVEYKGELLGLCFDLHGAYQLIYQDIHNRDGHCEMITKDDFEE